MLLKRESSCACLRCSYLDYVLVVSDNCMSQGTDRFLLEAEALQWLYNCSFDSISDRPLIQRLEGGSGYSLYSSILRLGLA